MEATHDHQIFSMGITLITDNLTKIALIVIGLIYISICVYIVFSILLVYILCNIYFVVSKPSNYPRK